ncbi:MAG TPA: Rsd/AlgQ family anti-sigma factor [Gammaproteobacteria bacterium]|nr:Rsd/AlgQ family anti-sigma factor [Gammaproteobacteria bacterium]
MKTKPTDIQAQFLNSIQQWLNLRQKMIVAFNELCLLKPFEIIKKPEIQTCVDNFCNELVDYLSFGQFKVFEQLSSIDALRTEDRKSIQALWCKIFSTTVTAIEFSDLYTHNLCMATLQKDLSKLGVQLAHRLDWEDQILEILYRTMDFNISPS